MVAAITQQSMKGAVTLSLPLMLYHMPSISLLRICVVVAIVVVDRAHYAAAACLIINAAAEIRICCKQWGVRFTFIDGVLPT
jgi:hypothetical protein